MYASKRLCLPALAGALFLSAVTQRSNAVSVEELPAATGRALARPAVMTTNAARAVLLGVARAGSRLVAVGERGIVVLSDDGGRTWRQTRSPVSVTLTAVRFVDAKVGYAVGHGGLVLATTDAGDTWVKRLDGIQAAQLVLKAAHESGDARLQKDAERLVADGADKPLLDLYFFDAKRGIVVGAYNLIFLTEDGGLSWQSLMGRLDNPKGLHLYAIRALGDEILIAGEQGLVLRSTDAGRSFKRLDVGYKGTFFTAGLPARDEIVLGGLRGNLWRSTDRGETWVQIAVPVPVSFTSSNVESDGSMVLANQAGMLFRERNGSVQTFGPVLPPINDLLPVEKGEILALTPKGVLIVPVSQSGDSNAGGVK